MSRTCCVGWVSSSSISSTIRSSISGGSDGTLLFSIGECPLESKSFPYSTREIGCNHLNVNDPFGFRAYRLWQAGQWKNSISRPEGSEGTNAIPLQRRHMARLSIIGDPQNLTSRSFPEQIICQPDVAASRPPRNSSRGQVRRPYALNLGREHPSHTIKEVRQVDLSRADFYTR